LIEASGDARVSICCADFFGASCRLPQEFAARAAVPESQTDDRLSDTNRWACTFTARSTPLGQLRFSTAAPGNSDPVRPACRCRAPGGGGLKVARNILTESRRRLGADLDPRLRAAVDFVTPSSNPTHCTMFRERVRGRACAPTSRTTNFNRRVGSQRVCRPSRWGAACLCEVHAAIALCSPAFIEGDADGNILQSRTTRPALRAAIGPGRGVDADARAAAQVTR